ncbi:MAG TPA: hypothetical protein VLF95_10805 [Vicinamibacteria bacterium]|nr:hypothetical protein [Vicinamibacteria bacterium]
MVDPAAVAEEQTRADRLRRTVDVACAVLRQGCLPRAEAEALVAETRRRALALFPGKEDVFDLVLAPRFRRILDEFCLVPGARVLPFRKRGSDPSRLGPPDVPPGD